jgi:outer membrane biosynthesis protein TonB
MSGGRRSYFVYAVSALALALVMAGCTKGGQFDPTEMFNTDMFDTKKKLKGERVPVFPEGVPGATSGVPPDLVKGYQPPPEPAEADAALPGPTPPAETAEAAKPKPKPKPKPKLAVQKPPAASSTRINVGPGNAGQSDGSVWPAPPQNNAPQQAQSSQPAWPAPPAQSSQSAQPIWPNPPPPGASR